MGHWSYYFFCKLFLHLGGYIEFHLWTNLAFALLLMVPLSQRGLRILRQVVAIPTALALLYHDSSLPPPSRVLSQMDLLLQFETDYMLELVGRVFDWRVVLGLVLLYVVYAVLGRILRMSTLALLGIVLVPLILHVQSMLSASEPPPATGQLDQVTAIAPAAVSSTAETLDDALDHFYERESDRRVQFTPQDDGGPEFDIVLLHTCSLSWDDLDFLGMAQHELLSRFDVVFTHFNSVATYSGPAAIRLLRGVCGQSAQSALYDSPVASCLLMRQLQEVGLAPQWTLNHDGAYGGFANDVRANLGTSAPQVEAHQATATQKAFDGSLVHSDYEVLAHWWRRRLEDRAPAVALYYNTASLHDGNRALKGPRIPREVRYRLQLRTYLDDVSRFIRLIEESGRYAIVVLVPEHGAAIRGDRMQISGLREIPTPAITTVPLGIL